MSQIRAGQLSNLLNTIFDANKGSRSKGQPWNDSQYQAYRVIQDHVNDYETNFRNFLTNLDRQIIYTNIKDQSWYLKSTGKQLIRDIIGSMKVIHHFYRRPLDGCQTLRVRLMMETFCLDFGLHQEKAIPSLQSHIIIEGHTNGKKSILMCFYTVGIDRDQSRKIAYKKPNIDEIYETIQLEKDLISPNDFIALLREIIYFYDEAELMVEKIPLSNNSPLTLKNYKPK